LCQCGRSRTLCIPALYGLQTRLIPEFVKFQLTQLYRL